MHMIFKSAFLKSNWLGKYSLKVLKLVENLTLNCYFEGLIPAMELKLKRNTELYGTSDVDKSS